MCKMSIGIVLFCWILVVTESTERSRGALGPRVFTFVHGDDKAKLDFASADEYCKRTVGQGKSAFGDTGFIEEPVMFEEGGDRIHRWSNHSHNADLVLETRLASVHSYPETLALVKWVSKQEKHSFWIGGTVSKTLNEYMRPICVLQWTDGSRSDFSLLRLPNEELSNMRVGEQRCISVDYLSGQWGVHPCTEKRYFVCLTVPVLKSASDTEPKVTEKQNELSRTTKPVVSMYEPWTVRHSTQQKAPEQPHHRMTAEELRKLLS
ncbi:unnamed protein product [Echinostoma caproni]|uniref:C-type lectin domain-containing protein n=1 Tax=Echinostoma caproni TaxID=27848 RepID=A0A183AHC2_9TREM|nr:unnamed protein product [Echinostoma caproni]